ncbi:MAG: alpha/beta hydrolase [Glaciihabitans sp.]|nr:alpha/beta hydrolase [Glaciihabitans sp.]
MVAERVTSYRHAGLQFDVTDSGPIDGPVIILLHGFPPNRSSWERVAHLLNEAGLRTLAPDQRGYSPQARPRRRLSYRSDDIARDAIALIDEVNCERVHVVGHDWGGFVAWKLATSVPERLNGVTVLSTPHPKALVRSLLSSAQILRSGYIGFFQIPALPEIVLRRHLGQMLRRFGLPASIADEYQRFMRQPDALRGALNWYRGMLIPARRGAGKIGTGDDRVHIPTTYVWGNCDTALGPRAAHLTKHYVDGPYRFVELDENHWLPERVPGRVAQEIIADVTENRRFRAGSPGAG